MTWKRIMLAYALALLVAVPSGARERKDRGRIAPAPYPDARRGTDRYEHARLETLWIFDADFEDLTGDNAGWRSYDRSGTLGQENYWHKDTIRIRNFTHLGDSTWWCGKYDDCWIQPRGYGNNWYQLLHRDLPLSQWSSAGDAVTLEWDQRYAMESAYDYGYVEVSSDGGETWTVLAAYENIGFAGTPGMSVDWDWQPHCHPVLDVSAFAGSDVRLRYRFESDASYSSEDEYNYPPTNPCLDGAWQLDNIEWKVNDVTVWLDDCEAPGDNGWVHEDVPTTGQTGVTFWRGLYGTDFSTGYPEVCESRSGWMMVAHDPLTGLTVDGMDAWLVSPPIDISGAEKLVGQWDVWCDLPVFSNNHCDLWVAVDDDSACVRRASHFVDEEPGTWWYYYGPYWATFTDDWDWLTGNDWLALRWMAWNDYPAEPGMHTVGFLLNRQRVGVVTGVPETSFHLGAWDYFHDWYQEELPDAMLDTLYLRVSDPEGVASVTLLASGSGGAMWEAYACLRDGFSSEYWRVPPPSSQMLPGSEIFYYFEAVDSLGGVSVFPSNAPDEHFDFSILPITASPSEPGILLVDKHGRGVPGEQRDYRHDSEYYYREALEILGYEWDVYDVEVPSATVGSDGPDSAAFKYYDTVIWFTGDFDNYTFTSEDQHNLVSWLSQAEFGKERNLLVAGNDWARELEWAFAGTSSFMNQWLAVHYIQDGIGTAGVDTLPLVKDCPGGHTFLDHDDGAGVLAGGCPKIAYFDVLNVQMGASGAECVALYERQDAVELSAGVANTPATVGCQTVALGFGFEYMMDSLDPATGYYNTGVADRVNLLENIMAYFAMPPNATPTEVQESTFRNAFSHATPNPFNPATTISYSVREAGPVSIVVYDVAGRRVRTLLDAEVDAGAEGRVVWDGTDDAGETCASGVYFCRMVAPSFAESRKLVLLK